MTSFQSTNQDVDKFGISVNNPVTNDIIPISTGSMKKKSFLALFIVFLSLLENGLRSQHEHKEVHRGSGTMTVQKEA